MHKTTIALLIAAMLVPGLALAYDGDVGAPPEVFILNPADGDEVSGEVPVLVEAHDMDGFIIQVEFFIDGDMVEIDLDEPYECMWNTENLEYDSWHEIYATALSDDGETGISLSVMAKVKKQYFSGKVTARDLDDSTITVREPQTKTKKFVITPTTTIVDKNGKKIKLSDISNNDNVDVEYERKNNKNVATKITRTNR
jgi:hypothetical protein